MLTRFHGGLLPIAVALLIAAAPASAAAQSSVVADCYAHGQLTGTYTVAQLRQALQTMPPTVKEYTSCYDTIQAALLKQVGQGTGGSGGSSGQSSSGGSFLPTPVIVLLAVLALAGVAFAALALRRRSTGPPGAPGRETGV